MNKRILCCLSEWGYWGEELVGPYDVLTKNGYEIDFMTPTGNKPPALPPSMDAAYVDPPLGIPVTSDHFARRTREIQESDLLDNPRSLADWFPQMPYFNSENFGHRLVEYHRQRSDCWHELDDYDALLLPGGSGPMVDMVNNEQLHAVIRGFLAKDKLIAAECYCVTALAFARDWTERKSIIGESTSPGMPENMTTRTLPGLHIRRSRGSISVRRSIPWNTSCVMRWGPAGSTTAAWARRYRPSSIIPS